MKTRDISLIALCAALAACNSKPSDTNAASTKNVGQAAENSALPSAPTAAIAPAPEGLPSRVAKEVIAAGGQKCEGIVKADRNAQDGSIVASCTGGESYRVSTVDGQPVATSL